MRTLLHHVHRACAWLLLVLPLPALVPVSPASAALQVYYAASDLPDGVPTEDLWQFDYVLSGYDFALGDAIEIAFPELVFAQVQALPADGWETLVFAPDPFTSYFSFVAAALDTRSSPQTLSVIFEWVGGNEQSPGSQRYALLAGGFEDPIEGATIAGPPDPIPEPGSILLLLAGLGVLGLSRRSRAGR